MFGNNPLGKILSNVVQKKFGNSVEDALKKKIESKVGTGNPVQNILNAPQSFLNTLRDPIGTGQGILEQKMALPMANIEDMKNIITNPNQRKLGENLYPLVMRNIKPSFAEDKPSNFANMNNAYRASLENKANTQNQIKNSLGRDRDNQGYFKKENKGIYDDIDFNEIFKNLY